MKSLGLVPAPIKEDASCLDSEVWPLPQDSRDLTQERGLGPTDCSRFFEATPVTSSRSQATESRSQVEPNHLLEKKTPKKPGHSFIFSEFAQYTARCSSHPCLLKLLFWSIIVCSFVRKELRITTCRDYRDRP